ncbi:hypothetical protein OBBRIDRAFT_888765 [Obba rivulosa]|uniref:DUF6534 domain-containing protein n=1 Tax=Obba rivulosa TaxID=1052685 RepID=A0A8E2DJC8_9APHY|nr:hypothetical protein OBBRIDRAFT_888765 [Obba rivulosa]
MVRITMSAIPDEAIQAVVVPTCGALLITLVFSAIFFGITVLQTYIYYDKYWDDRAYLKTFVIVLALLDMAHMATVIDSVWFYVVSHFGDLSLLDTFSPGILAETATTVTIGLLVQCFFAMRVWLTNDRKVMIPMLIVVLSGAQFALGIYFASIPPVDQNLLFFPQLSWVPISGLCCGLAADVLITISLCYNLHKIRSGIRRADKVVNIVIMYTVNTGLLTSIIAVLSIILGGPTSRNHRSMLTPPAVEHICDHILATSPVLPNKQVLCELRSSNPEFAQQAPQYAFRSHFGYWTAAAD